MSEEEKTSGLPKYWIWILLIVLISLLIVPVLSMGLAIQKTGWMPVHRAPKPQLASPPETESPEAVQLKESSMTLREKVEKMASAIIRVPTLHPKMQQVQVQTSAPTMQKASESIHRVLDAHNQQFVEAVEPNQIRIVVILPSKDWPSLSGSLQVAAEKDGYLYRGPSQTSSGADSADTMVAEIEILRKQPKKGK
jgi:hypothetical protein